MPYYQYRCNDCENEFETRQRMSDEPLTDCPMCNGRVRRVVKSIGVVFKGSGFYVTDARNGSSASSPNGTSKTAETKTGENGSSASAASETAKTDTTKTETAKNSSENKPKEPVAAK